MPSNQIPPPGPPCYRSDIVIDGTTVLLIGASSTIVSVAMLLMKLHQQGWF